MGSSSSTAAKAVPFRHHFRKWNRQQVQRAWKRAFQTCSAFLVEGEAVPFSVQTPAAAAATLARTPAASTRVQRLGDGAEEEGGAVEDEMAAAPLAPLGPLTDGDTGIVDAPPIEGLTIDTSAPAIPAAGVPRQSEKLPGWQSRADRAHLVTKNRLAGLEKPLLVTRRDFLEIFTDITTMSDGQFLQLPIEVFDWFADMDIHSDDHYLRGTDESKHYCDCRIVLLALTLACNATPKEVGMILFRAYDVDGSGSICATELRNLLEGLLCIGVKTKKIKTDTWTTQEVLDAAIMQLSGNIFHEIDLDNEGSATVVQWQQRGLPILNAPSFPMKLATVVETHAMQHRDASRYAAERRVAMPVGAARRGRRSSMAEGIPEAATRKEAGKRRRRGASKGRRASIQSLALIDRLASTALTVSRAKDSMVKKVLVQRVTSWTRFSSKQVDQLMRVFGAVSKKGHRVGVEGLREILRRCYPRTASRKGARTRENVTRRLFQFFNTTGSTTLGFMEFGVGMATLLQGTPDERYRAVFAVLDMQNRHRITQNEIARFLPSDEDANIEAFAGNKGCATVMTQFLFEQIQIAVGAHQHHGQPIEIHREQFVELCRRAPLWYDCFLSALFPGSHKSPVPACRCVQAPCSAFDMDMMVALWKRCQGHVNGRTGLSLPRFRVFMMEDFECTPDMLPIATRVFKLFDSDNSGELDWKELVGGLARVLGGKLEDATRFFFRLYDIDQDGSVTREEIMRLYMSSKLGAENARDHAANLLNMLDDNSDSNISYEEFVAAVERDPGVLECFGALFGVHSIVQTPEARRRPTHRKRAAATWDISSDMVGSAATRAIVAGGSATNTASGAASSAGAGSSGPATPGGSVGGNRRRSAATPAAADGASTDGTPRAVASKKLGGGAGLRRLRRISLGHVGEVVSALRRFQHMSADTQGATHAAIRVRNTKLASRLKEASRDLRSDINVAEMRLSDWVHGANKYGIRGARGAGTSESGMSGSSSASRRNRPRRHSIATGAPASRRSRRRRSTSAAAGRAAAAAAAAAADDKDAALEAQLAADFAKDREAAAARKRRAQALKRGVPRSPMAPRKPDSPASDSSHMSPQPSMDMTLDGMNSAFDESDNEAATPTPRSSSNKVDGSDRPPRPPLLADGSFNWKVYASTSDGVGANRSGAVVSTSKHGTIKFSLPVTAKPAQEEHRDASAVGDSASPSQLVDDTGSGAIPFGTPISSFQRAHGRHGSVGGGSGGPPIKLPTPTAEGGQSMVEVMGDALGGTTISAAEKQEGASANATTTVVAAAAAGAGAQSASSTAQSAQDGGVVVHQAVAPRTGSPTYAADGIIGRVMSPGKRSPSPQHPLPSPATSPSKAPAAVSGPSAFQAPPPQLHEAPDATQKPSSRPGRRRGSILTFGHAGTPPSGSLPRDPGAGLSLSLRPVTPKLASPGRTQHAFFADSDTKSPCGETAGHGPKASSGDHAGRQLLQLRKVGSVSDVTATLEGGEEVEASDLATASAASTGSRVVVLGQRTSSRSLLSAPSFRVDPRHAAESELAPGAAHPGVATMPFANIELYAGATKVQSKRPGSSDPSVRKHHAHALRRQQAASRQARERSKQEHDAFVAKGGHMQLVGSHGIYGDNMNNAELAMPFLQPLGPTSTTGAMPHRSTASTTSMSRPGSGHGPHRHVLAHVQAHGMPSKPGIGAIPRPYPFATQPEDWASGTHQQAQASHAVALRQHASRRASLTMAALPSAHVPPQHASPADHVGADSGLLPTTAVNDGTMAPGARDVRPGDASSNAAQVWTVATNTRFVHHYNQDQLTVAQVAASRRAKAAKAMKPRHFQARFSRLARPLTASRSAPASTTPSRTSTSRSPAGSRPSTSSGASRASSLSRRKGSGGSGGRRAGPIELRPGDAAPSRRSRPSSRGAPPRSSSAEPGGLVGRLPGQARHRSPQHPEQWNPPPSRPRTSYGLPTTLVGGLPRHNSTKSNAPAGNKSASRLQDPEFIKNDMPSVLLDPAISAPATSTRDQGPRRRTRDRVAPQPQSRRAHSVFSPSHTMAHLHHERIAAHRQGYSRPLRTLASSRPSSAALGRKLLPTSPSLTVAGTATPLLDPFDRSHAW